MICKFCNVKFLKFNTKTRLWRIRYLRNKWLGTQYVCFSSAREIKTSLSKLRLEQVFERLLILLFPVRKSPLKLTFENRFQVCWSKFAKIDLGPQKNISFMLILKKKTILLTALCSLDLYSSMLGNSIPRSAHGCSKLSSWN